MDEHFVPTIGLELEEYARRADMDGAHHLVRYVWLTEVLAGTESRVLDLGCGAGYGTFLVARRLPDARVTGADYDPAGVESARSTYRRANLEFVVADAMKWDAPQLDGAFDAIVSFDSLEHIPHRELVLEQVVGHLPPAGAFYFSTPCGAPESDLLPSWEAHRIEYGTASLFDFLSRYFRTIVRPEDASFPGRHVFDRLRSLGIDYLLKCNPLICRDPVVVSNPYR